MENPVISHTQCTSCAGIEWGTRRRGESREQKNPNASDFANQPSWRVILCEAAGRVEEPMPAGERRRRTGILLTLMRSDHQLGSVISGLGTCPKDFLFRAEFPPLAFRERRARAPAPHTSSFTLPASRRTGRSTRSRGRSSGCGTSRWGHAGCRRAGRSPSSRWEFSARPENRSRWESTHPSG